MAPADPTKGGPLFDMDYFLESTSKIQAARRRGIHKLIPVEYLPDELRRLYTHSIGVVTFDECRELLAGLVEDGLIQKDNCKYFLS